MLVFAVFLIPFSAITQISAIRHARDQDAGVSQEEFHRHGVRQKGADPSLETRGPGYSYP
jgi:hypothetical protein